MLLQKPSQCKGCPLETLGQGFSEPEGVGSIPLLIVGESLGYNEMLEGLPFRPSAQAGSILHRVIQEKGKYNRSQFAFWNLCACHPPSDKLSGTSYEYEAVNHCRVYFDKVIERYKPKVILACGALPFKHLVGLTGKNTDISKVRGYVFKSKYPDVLVVPTFHPSFIRRGNSNLINVLVWDFMKAVGIAQGKEESYIIDPINQYKLKPFGYLTNPSVEAAFNLLEYIKQNSSILISYDIETEKSQGVDEDELTEYGQNITQIQFSVSPNSGIAMPWIEPFITISKNILATINPKSGHNVWDFDNPILKKSDVIINGRIDDTMLMFHHWQADLPLNLQFVSSFYNFPFPWKHYAGSNLPFYGIADVDSVQYIMQSLPKQLKDRNLWDGYEKLVRELKPILIKVENRGLPINIKKQDEFRTHIELREKEIEKELNKVIPESFIRYFPTRGYVREPKELVGVVQRFIISNNRLATEDEIEVEAKKIGLVKRDFNDEKRWCKEEYFNPESVDQVSDFIKHNKDTELAKKLAVKIAKDSRLKGDEHSNGKDNVSTSKTVLKNLAIKTGRKEYSLIVEHRELSKMAGTFLWKPSEDGRVHTHFGFRTGSGQLTSRDYNIQQGPEHYKLAEKFKETIEAGEGKVLIKVDYKAFFVRMLGFLAEDKSYYRLAQTDPHAFVTAHMVGFPRANECINYSDENLISYLNEVKKEHSLLRNTQAKRTVLGMGNGLSEKGCYERYKDDFNPSKEDVLSSWGRKKKNPLDINPKSGASYLQEEIERRGKERTRNLYILLRKLFPSIFRYHEKILKEASEKGYIDTPFGFRRWFPAASEPTYDRYGNIQSIKKGEQAEEALAYPLANNSYCFLREGVIIADNEGILDRLGMVNWVHDDLRFEAEEENFKEDLMKLLTILERESTVLVNGLGKFSCKADVKIGKNLANMEEFKI